MRNRGILREQSEEFGKLDQALGPPPDRPTSLRALVIVPSVIGFLPIGPSPPPRCPADRSAPQGSTRFGMGREVKMGVLATEESARSHEDFLQWGGQMQPDHFG